MKEETKKKYHKFENVLLKFSSVGITKEVHRILRVQKKIQSKSMMQLVQDLVMEAYGK